MRPSKKLIHYLLVWLGLGLLVFAVRLYYYLGAEAGTSGAAITRLYSGANLAENAWWISASLLLFIVFIDALRHRSFNNIVVTRTLPRSLALSVNTNIQLNIENPYYFPLTISFTEDYPAEVKTDDLPLSFTILADSHKSLCYQITPVKRGEAHFGKSSLRVSTRWGFWQKLEKLGNESNIKIYPNFAPIAHFASVGLEHQIAQLGIHLQHRRGEGSDFHQLREFRAGDAMRQIDWKATARHRRPISRDYQDERDQEVIFLLDCGRRMRHKEGDTSHFDHALNALLLTAFVALRQGDSVGLMSFAGEQRWMKPVKGPSQINTLLNQLYDLHSSTTTSDYLQTAENFLSKYNKRSLVVLISNIQQSDSADLSAAAQLLSKKHVVLVASLRDEFLDQTLNKDINNFNDALNYCGTSEFMNERRKILTTLQNLGVIMTDSLPSDLHLDLVTQYLKVKRSHRL